MAHGIPHPPTKYTCSECGSPATILPGAVVERSCDHADASIVADLHATAYGKGGAES